MASRVLEHHVNPRAFTAAGLHWLLLRTDLALAVALAAGQVTAKEAAERHNLLSVLYARLIGEDPRYLAARLGGPSPSA